VLSPDVVLGALSERALPWALRDGALERVVEHRDFATALAFVDAVGWLAEVADHHPDVDIRWGTVTLRLVTHSAGGITSRDLDLAAAVEGLLHLS
jgi:4a-hydroxytetrahydrobiopterin dehydratase